MSNSAVSFPLTNKKVRGCFTLIYCVISLIIFMLILALQTERSVSRTDNYHDALTFH